MLPPLKPEHQGKKPRADFLFEHFPDLKDQREDLPKFKPVGEIGVEVDELGQKAYELHGPAIPRYRRSPEEFHLEKLNNQIEILKQIDETYYQDLTKHKDPGPKIVTYD